MTTKKNARFEISPVGTRHPKGSRVKKNKNGTISIEPPKKNSNKK